MANTIPLKSLSTGLVGLYPENHLGLDPDLVAVTSDEDQCIDCWLPASETVTDNKKTTRNKSNG